jgi:hypothetical protein
MSEEPMPGTSSEDRALIERWRRGAVEEPSAATAERIRAAARDSLAAPPSDAVRPPPRRARWTAFAPLAAAASVALLAVGLVRLMPREEYQPREAYRAPPAREGAPVESPAAPDMTPDSPADAGPASTRQEAAAGQEGDESFVPEPANVPAGTQHNEPRDARHATLGTRAEPAHEATARDARPASPSPPREPRPVDAEKAGAAQPRATEARARTGGPLAPAVAVPPAPQTAITSTTGLHQGAVATSHIPPELATLIRNDASRRTGAVPDAITIVAVAPITWRDASLGCDSAGETPPDARVPGYVVTVEASGTILHYHADGRDRIALCDAQ